MYKLYFYLTKLSALTCKINWYNYWDIHKQRDENLEIKKRVDWHPGTRPCIFFPVWNLSIHHCWLRYGVGSPLHSLELVHTPLLITVWSRFSFSQWLKVTRSQAKINENIANYFLKITVSNKCLIVLKCTCIGLQKSRSELER